VVKRCASFVPVAENKPVRQFREFLQTPEAEPLFEEIENFFLESNGDDSKSNSEVIQASLQLAIRRWIETTQRPRSKSRRRAVRAHNSN